MADTLISGIFVTRIYGYGIFGQKITGIRDIKTPLMGVLPVGKILLFHKVIVKINRVCFHVKFNSTLTEII